MLYGSLGEPSIQYACDMSSDDLIHVSKGRTPWRRHFQLRRKPIPKEFEPEPVPALYIAARTAEPPNYLPDWQRHEVLRRLISLCEWLDDRLDRPAHTHTNSKDCRQVHVFEGLSYFINYEKRYITSGSLINGRYEPTGAVFEVGRPLTSHQWILPILKNLNLANGDQGDIFFDVSMVDDIAQWMAETAYRLLLRNPDFQEFRRITLPRQFKLPKDIYSIAMASRPRPIGPLIDSRTMNDVWRNEKAFRQVARENSQLLPLLLAFIEQIPPGQIVHTKDPIMTLKNKFRASGISEAAWRYLVRYGARLFRVPWEISNGQSHLDVAIRYLEALQFADLPPPPPPSVVKAFLHGYNNHRDHDARIAEHFQCKIDPVVLRVGIWEADRRRQDGTVEGFAEEFLGVCWWSEGVAHLLDDNQAKAGWKWFVRRWQEEEEAQALLEDVEPLHWLTRVEECQVGQFTVVPINSSEELIRESLAMRNCVQTYMNDCVSGDFEVYSVRDSRTGKRRGCIGFSFDSDGTPTIEDIKGFANTPPRGEVKQVAYGLFVKLQDVEWD